MRGNVKRFEQHLQVLVGLPLQYMGRAGDLEWLGFGATRAVTNERGQTRELADYALHVQCPWRLTSPDGILVGSSDYYVPVGYPAFDPDDFRWDVQGANQHDARVDALRAAWADAPLVVTSVTVDALGGIRLQFTGGCALELLPVTSLPIENWRLFRPGSDADHIVCFDGEGDAE